MKRSPPIPLAEQHQHAIQALADEYHRSRNVVEQMYLMELTRLEPDARVTRFLPIVTSRRVRDILEQTAQPL